jgi:hypothetical protein
VPVLKKIGHVLLIIAVLAATGTHWLVLQSVAWTTMFAGNLQSNSLAQAMERTFDGKHPCSLCKQISKGKQEEKKSEFQSDSKRLDFSYAPSAFSFDAPSQFTLLPARDDSADTLAHSPPVPPPRPFFA